MKTIMKMATVAATHVRPVFVNNCAECKFLGRVNDQDMYYCATRGEYICRFGDAEGDYGSAYLDLAPSGTYFALAAEIVRRGLPPCAWNFRRVTDLGLSDCRVMTIFCSD